MATPIADIPAGDRKRFAICYQNATDKQAVDWAAAATAYDPNVKEASFKTVTMRALKKSDTPDVAEGDINRMALCFAYSSNKSAVDWTAAAAAYDPKVKQASFKTVTLRAVKKHGYTEAAVSGAATPRKRAPVKKAAAQKTAGGKKRKASKNDDDDDEDYAATKKPRKTLKTLKKDESDEEEAHDDGDEFPQEGSDVDDEIKTKDVSDSEDEAGEQVYEHVEEPVDERVEEEPKEELATEDDV